MLDNPVKEATKQLLCALQDTQAFQTYQTLKDDVMSDPITYALYQQFTRAQTSLQMAAMAGHEATEEETSQFERLSALLYGNTELTDFLLAKMRVQQLVGETIGEITKATDIDIELPAL